MGYEASEPLKRWRGARSDTIAVLASGHAGIGRVTGPGRPLNVSKPLAHAYVITMLSEFARLGLSPLDIGTHNKHWSGRTGDASKLDQLVALRNVLGHGNDSGLRTLLAAKEVQDTISWARRQLPVLNRYARALDRVAWNHLIKLTGKEPWA